MTGTQYMIKEWVCVVNGSSHAPTSNGTWAEVHELTGT